MPCEHRDLDSGDPHAVVHVILLLNTQELYCRICPIPLKNYKFELLEAKDPCHYLSGCPRVIAF